MRQLLYAWFRLGAALADLPEEERLTIALFLCANATDKLAVKLFEAHSAIYASQLSVQLAEKVKFLRLKYPDFSIASVFQFGDFISEKLHINRYTEQLLQQPPVWLRIRRGFKEQVTAEFRASEITFTESNSSALALAIDQGVKLQELKSFQNGLFEIQDISSQLCGNYFKPTAGEKWYDCCAASGGKSLLLLDQCKDIQLTVSDSRSSSLKNLYERFAKSGNKPVLSFVCDLEERIPSEISLNSLDGIILDAPCSGSGTWGRNPEEMARFDSTHLKMYHDRQVRIAEHVSPFLKPGKPLIYSTCSVFKTENEDVVQRILQLGFVLEEMQLLEPKNELGDTLFVARLLRV
jgi:16S rRNA (cytosine967-C5)-methyltransferase